MTRPGDKTPSVVICLFSLGIMAADDRMTKPVKTPFVVKPKGTQGRRQRDDKTFPPLWGRVLSSSVVPLLFRGQVGGGDPLSFAPIPPLRLGRPTTKPGLKAKRVLSSAWSPTSGAALPAVVTA